MRPRRTAGFTLIELMVTVAIVALLLTIGLPSFQSSLRSNRLATTTNELMASLALARSEAIRSPGGAWICTSTDGVTCNGDSWNDGWMVWRDADEADGSTQPTDDDDLIVRYVQGRDKIDIAATALSGAEEDANNNQFVPPGRIQTGQRDIDIQPEGCASGQSLLRTVVVTPSGQVKVEKGMCT